jgi:hypothetical protein
MENQNPNNQTKSNVLDVEESKLSFIVTGHADGEGPVTRIVEASSDDKAGELLEKAITQELVANYGEVASRLDVYIDVVIPLDEALDNPLKEASPNHKATYKTTWVECVVETGCEVTPDGRVVNIETADPGSNGMRLISEEVELYGVDYYVYEDEGGWRIDHQPGPVANQQEVSA